MDPSPWSQHPRWIAGPGRKIVLVGRASFLRNRVIFLAHWRKWQTHVPKCQLVVDILEWPAGPCRGGGGGVAVALLYAVAELAVPRCHIKMPTTQVGPTKVDAAPRSPLRRKQTVERKGTIVTWRWRAARVASLVRGGAGCVFSERNRAHAPAHSSCRSLQPRSKP
nr:unnamed protein product [Digitaria exilis]